ncbi:MAG: hypothetical protein H5T96_09915, partial [Tissierellales bacterium]|nr:hypothetical protein [Tissierellales bacterium]
NKTSPVELVVGEWYEVKPNAERWIFKFHSLTDGGIFNSKSATPDDGYISKRMEGNIRSLSCNIQDCKPANMEEVYKLFPEERKTVTSDEKTELSIDDLTEGEIYVYDCGNIFIGKFKEADGEDVHDYYYINISDGEFERKDYKCTPKSIRHATPEERKWIMVCDKQDMFIDEEDLNYYDDNGDLIKKPPKKSKKVKQSISMEKKEESLPFKVGDKVRIKSTPDEWSSALNQNDGRYKVKYPYEMIIEAIEYRKDTNHIAISDGLYGWTYKPDLFEKVEEQEWWKSLKKGDYVVCIEEGHDLVYKNHIYDVIDIDEDGWISHSILENGSTNNGYKYVNYRLATPEEIKMYISNGGSCNVTTYKIPSKEFVLPEKWCVKDEGQKELGDYFNRQYHGLAYPFENSYLCRYNLAGEDIMKGGNL